MPVFLKISLIFCFYSIDLFAVESDIDQLIKNVDKALAPKPPSLNPNKISPKASKPTAPKIPVRDTEEPNNPKLASENIFIVSPIGSMMDKNILSQKTNSYRIAFGAGIQQVSTVGAAIKIDETSYSLNEKKYWPVGLISTDVLKPPTNFYRMAIIYGLRTQLQIKTVSTTMKAEGVFNQLTQTQLTDIALQIPAIMEAEVAPDYVLGFGIGPNLQYRYLRSDLQSGTGNAAFYSDSSNISFCRNFARTRSFCLIVQADATIFKGNRYAASSQSALFTTTAVF